MDWYFFFSMNTHKTRGPVYIHVKISSCVKQVHFHFEKLILSRSVYSESLIFKIFVYKYTDLKFLNNVRVCLLQQIEKFWTKIRTKNTKNSCVVWDMAFTLKSSKLTHSLFCSNIVWHNIATPEQAVWTFVHINIILAFAKWHHCIHTTHKILGYYDY